MYVSLKKERQTRLELATPTLARSCPTNGAIPACTFLVVRILRKFENLSIADLKIIFKRLKKLHFV